MNKGDKNKTRPLHMKKYSTKTNGLLTRPCDFCMGSEDSGERRILRITHQGLSDLAICSICLRSLMCELESVEQDEILSTKESGIRPYQIEKILSKYVIGQKEAIETLSVAIWKHNAVKLINESINPFNEETLFPVEKENVLIIGPTGVGKTLMVEILAKKLEVPMSIVSATSITQAGYVGDDAPDVLTNLLRIAGGDIAQAEQGIVFIDEIDKLAPRGLTGDSIQPSHTGAQNAFLTMLQGSVVKIPAGFSSEERRSKIDFDTSEVMFIAAGAFNGLAEIIHKRTHSQQIGFGSNLSKISSDELLSILSDEDLQQFGLIPELIGRLHTIIILNDLGAEDFKNILISSGSSCLKQFQLLFRVENLDLQFSENAILEIAKEATESKTGARVLRRIISRITKKAFSKIGKYPNNVTGLLVDSEAVKTGDLKEITFNISKNNFGDKEQEAGGQR